MIDFIKAHYGTIIAISAAIVSHLVLFATAAIRTMPNPGVTLDKAARYKWLYDWLHQAFNVTSDKSLVRDQQLPQGALLTPNPTTEHPTATQP